jgi:tetrahydromethanopterin S-methyltransferase subunit E
MARNIRRTLDAGEPFAYGRLRGLRLNVAQVLIASLRRKPTLVLAAMGAVVLYSTSIVYFVLKHFAGHS